MTLSSIATGSRPLAASNAGYKQVSTPTFYSSNKRDTAIISETAKELAAQKTGSTSREEATESPNVERKEQASGLA
jgi:hypothetical protein